MKQLTNKDLYKISDNFMEKLNRVFEETKAELTELSQKRLADYKEKAIIGAAKNAITKDGDSKTLEKRQKGIKTASDKMEYGVDGERERADRGDRYQKKAKPVKESSDDVKTDVDGRGHYKVNYVFPDKKKIGNDRFETKGEAIKFANALKKKGYHNVSIGEEIEDDASAIDEMKLSTSPVERAIYQRLTATGKMNNLLRKHGLDKVMDAIRNEADWAGDVEEIGSSDVSIWVNRVLKDLKEEIETNESVTTPMSTEHIGIYKIVVDRDNKITVTDTKTKETKVMDSKFVDDVMENDRFWKMPVIKQVSTVKSWFEKGGS